MNYQFLDNSIQYKSGYKYQLAYTCQLRLPNELWPGAYIGAGYIHVDSFGLMTILKGYAWDGCSGPTIDTKSSMRGGLVHDAGYQLIRLGFYYPDTKDTWDALAEAIWKGDGMWHWRASAWDKMLHKFGWGSTKPSAERPTLVAP